MRDEQKTPQPQPRQPKIENLELNRETVEDLGEKEQEGVKGGAMVMGRPGSSTSCAPNITC